MIHPDTSLKNTPSSGLGIFANRRFKRGEILWILDEFDVRIPVEKFPNLPSVMKKHLKFYMYRDNQSRFIMPWDAAKFVNHSCNPNSGGIEGIDFISVALRDIEAGEEILENYHGYTAYLNNFKCECGAPNCSGWVRRSKMDNARFRILVEDIAEDMMALPQPMLDNTSEDKIGFLAFLEKTIREKAA